MISRPNLINPKRSIKISNIQNDYKYEPVVLNKYQKIKRNSFYLNLLGVIILIGISYFLYQVYIERKITEIENEYMDNVMNL